MSTVAIAPLVADATQVVLMRKGTRTVMSMQNNYKGPAEAFAMVIPVPVVLKEQDVKIAAAAGVCQRRAHGGAAPGRVLGAGSVPAGAGVRATWDGRGARRAGACQGKAGR